MSRFFLVRHGNINAEGKLVGRLDGYPLTPNGRDQIEYIGKQYLSGIKFNRFLCSPMERTRESAAIICNHIQLTPEIAEELNEIDFGDWTGKSFNELENIQEWKSFHSFRSIAKIPDGESITEIQKRTLGLVVDLHKNHSEGKILLITHAEVIKIILAHFAGINLDSSYRIQISTGSLSILTLNDGGAFIEAINLPGSVI